MALLEPALREIVRRPHARTFPRWAATRPEVLLLSADLSGSCEAEPFREAYPERFLSMGMAEQNMIGVAAGLAREGFSPWLHTFGVFLTRRPYDQVAMALAVPRLPVRLLGFLPGLTTPGGVTHQAIDDVGLMRLLPGMTVVELGDATDVETFYDAVEAVPGPVYVRMLRGELPRLFSRDDPFVLGRCRVLAEGEDWLVLTSGICTEQALAVLPLARARGLDAGHIHVGTLKPFHDEILLDALHRARKGVVVMENHGVEGGLGSAVAACMAEAGMGKPLVRLGLRDVWALGASRAWLAARFGIDGDALLGTLEKLSGLSLREA